MVTGLGVIAATGIGVDAFWKSTLAGVRALDLVEEPGCAGLPLRVGGAVRGFEAADAVPGHVRVQTDRFTHLAMGAAELALADAALPDAGPEAYDTGVVMAAGLGGVTFGQREIERLWSRGPRAVGPYQSIAWFYAAATGQLSIRHGYRGPCGVLADDEAGGLDALAHAARQLGRGARSMLAGAAEAPFCPFSVVCQLDAPGLGLGADPDRAYLPFTAGADGFAPAEAGVVLVVEEGDAAEERGAPVRALVGGHASTFTCGGDWAASREGLARAIRGALRAARIAPAELGVVFADALGTPAADRAEAQALADVFGPGAGGIPVTTVKPGTGRAYCAAAALDAAAAVLTLEHGVVPPVPGLGGARICHDLDVVTDVARAVAPRAALVLARGLSGSTTALVLCRADAE
ncbi:beta-ketoacyl synthase N-terminal-like domain-containing protein [Streptomyces sp.]|uniref:beta-ketoacyl synthase N-terminal-like domain-containing protein n=1 Tax=Streptomyces sp. TaxID=1931 RepID=UPI002F9302B2